MANKQIQAKIITLLIIAWCFMLQTTQSGTEQLPDEDRIFGY